jgi:site-specific recombinase XerD
MVARDAARQEVGRATPPDLRLVSAGTQITFDEHIERFLEWGRNVRHYSEGTLIAYQSDLGTLLRFLSQQYRITDPRGVTAAHMEEWLQSQGALKPNTLRRHLDCASTFFKYLARHGLADRNPAEGIIRPRHHPEEAKWVRGREFPMLRAATEGVLERAVWEVLAALAPRRSEVVGLVMGDLDRERATIHILGKGRKHRTLPVNSVACEALEQYLAQRPKEGSDALFIQQKGKCAGQPVTLKVLARMFRGWCKRAGLAGRGYTLHAVRHGVATLMHDKRVTLATIRDFLGHEDLQTTSLYIHSDDAQKRDAVELLVSDDASQRMTGDGTVQVTHGETEVVGRRVKPRVAEKPLEGSQVTSALKKQRRSRVSQRVQHDAGAAHAGPH